MSGLSAGLPAFLVQRSKIKVQRKRLNEVAETRPSGSVPEANAESRYKRVQNQCRRIKGRAVPAPLRARCLLKTQTPKESGSVRSPTRNILGILSVLASSGLATYCKWAASAPVIEPPKHQPYQSNLANSLNSVNSLLQRIAGGTPALRFNSPTPPTHNSPNSAFAATSAGISSSAFFQSSKNFSYSSLSFKILAFPSCARG